MLLTFILIIITSIPSTPHSFIPGLKLPFLQILPTIAFLFFRTDYMDSVDCLLILLSTSIFYFLICSVFHFLVLGSMQ